MFERKELFFIFIVLFIYLFFFSKCYFLILKKKERKMLNDYNVINEIICFEYVRRIDFIF